MIPRTRFARWALGGGLALVGLAAFAWLRPSPAARLTLAGGVELRVLGTSYGTQHGRPGFKRLLPLPVLRVVDRLFPGPLGPYEYFTPAASLVVWLAAQGPPGAPRPDVRLAFADEQGNFAGEPDAPSLGGGPPSIVLAGSPVFPRRNRELQLAVFEFGADGRYHRVGSLPIRNPVRGDYPVWQTEPLPAAQTNGNLVCRLVSVTTGYGISSSTRSEAGGKVRHTYSRAEEDAQNRAVLRLRFEDLEWPTNQWEVSAVVFADATGNLVNNSSLGSSFVENADYECVVGPALWPSESWRVGLAAVRRPSARFAPEEQLVLDHLALPEVGQTNALDRRGVLGDTEFRLKRIIRRPDLSGAEGWRHDELSQVELEAAGLPQGARVILLRAIDDRGRALSSASSSYGSDSGGATEFAYGFRDLAGDAQTLTLHVAVERPRQFTFTVQPALLGTNDFLRPYEAP